ncbi:MAG: C40 family peptidase [Chlorobi bacterium]|nr:C40 family peptidase [Chlorobiota bacterium]MCI0714926.1 C40 family peptidase [Chlorobiota bacterium]
MYKKLYALCFVLFVSFAGFVGCSGSSSNEEYSVKTNKKVKKQQEVASLTGIQKKSLIEQSSLETLTNIVSEYSNPTVDRDAVMIKIIELINTPYLWGGTTTNGIDCSAFCQRVMKYALNIDLPRTSIMQSTVGDEVTRENLQFGDLVFFNTLGRRISHVGIYLGEGVFAHSSSNGGVKTNSLDEEYYSSRYVTSRRVIK